MKTYASLQHLYYGIKALFSLTGILSLCGSDCNADAEMVEELQTLQHQIAELVGYLHVLRVLK